MNSIEQALAGPCCAALLVLVALPSVAAPASAPERAASAVSLASLCDGCGVVESVKAETRKGEGGALGMVGGAVLGGVLGHQIGGGKGKTLATVGGAAAGAYAGNEVQKSTSKSTVWLTRVTLKDGSQRTFQTSAEPGFKAGDVVRVSGDQIKRQ